jgi:SAM-dependent methyltransferase
MTAVDRVEARYYRRDLALVHHAGFGLHADCCAPGILALLEPVQAMRGLVVELGCGTGLLTRHLLDAGHRVSATDASLAMLEVARQYAPEVEEIYQVVLPEDPIPECDAIVSVGHVLNYLPDEKSLERTLIGAARALRPGGLLAIDLCDLEWGRLRRDVPPHAQVREDWAIVTRFSVPAPDQFVREITTFTRNHDGSWRRDDEKHDNVLTDTSRLPALLAEHGVEATIAPSFGDEPLPVGLVALMGRRVSA